MFSSLLTLFLPIYIVKYFAGDNKIILPVCCFIFAALVCAKTMGGYITFIIYLLVLSVYFMIVYDNKKKMIAKVLLLILAFIVVFLTLNLTNGNSYFNEIMQNRKNSVQYQERGFGNGRVYIWKMTLDIIKNNPVFGVGPDCLGHEVFYNYMNKPDYFFNDTLVDKAHCEYLHIAATTGIPSLIVYIVFIMRLRPKGKK